MKIFNLFKPNIEKLKTGKKVTPLIKALEMGFIILLH